jgi:molecular chaperone GrpE
MVLDKTDRSAENKYSEEESTNDGEQMQEAELNEESLEIHKQLKESQDLAAERLDQLMRCRADLDNTLKIVSRQIEENAKYATLKLISKLLCVLDSLEQASKHDEGCNILYNQLLDILKGEGLEPIDALGKKFDPFKHEALMQVKSDELEVDSIAQEIQRGYILNSKVIRFSKVAVVKR